MSERHRHHDIIHVTMLGTLGEPLKRWLTLMGMELVPLPDSDGSLLAAVPSPDLERTVGELHDSLAPGDECIIHWRGVAYAVRRWDGEPKTEEAAT